MKQMCIFDYVPDMNDVKRILKNNGVRFTKKQLDQFDVFKINGNQLEIGYSVGTRYTIGEAND